MKVLELFCGTKSISKVFKERGHDTFTVDFDNQFNPDLCIDILDFNVEKLPKEWRTPDVIWASPPCQTFSVASISRYWENNRPKNSACFRGLAIAIKTVEIIHELNPRYYFIENPRGMLRNQFFMENLHRKTVTYCQYGEKYQKPTDIWTNASEWVHKKMCYPGDNCHEFQPRGPGAKREFNVLDKGTQGLTDAKERGVIPRQLCEEIVKVCEGKQKVKQEVLLLDGRRR